jgi:hypothetical protein
MSKEFEHFLELINQAKDPETGYVGLSRAADDYLKNNEHSVEFMEEFLTQDFDFHARNYNTSLAENPSVTKGIIDKLVKKASHRWEWRSLNGYYATQLETAGIAIKWDYPHDLIGEQSSDAERTVLNVFSVMSYIAEDLWHDLGETELLDLIYEPDSFDGDHFGPEAISHGPTEYLLSPGYNCSWIELTRTIEIDRVLEVADDQWIYEDHWADDLTNGYNQANVFVQGIASGEIADYNGKLAGEYIEGYEQNEYYYETEMELRAFTYEGLRYKNLTPEQQMFLVSNLIFAHHNDVFLSHFRLTSHLLNLISVHPNTDEAVLEKIFSDKDPDISKGKELREITSEGGSI